MAVSLLAGLFAGIKALDGIVGEYWTRYFLINAALLGSNFFGDLTGIYPLEGLISFVISFFVSGFVFPIYYGISSLLIISMSMPVILYLIHTTLND